MSQIAGLPLERIVASLEAHPNLVLVAPPGTGKTTSVPLALLAAPFARDRRIVLLEPRRIAARAAAMRMAETIGEPVGRTVGYTTRTDRAVSAATRIEAVTEGLLAARLLADPTLEHVGCLILDEIHERRLDGDLCLALGLDLQRARPELRLLAMSATADARALAATMGGAPVIEVERPGFAVEIRHAARDLATPPRDLAERVASACRTALADHDGDILAFLPGKAEIGRAARALADAPAEIAELHGELSPERQVRALAPRAPDAPRRIVLATSIAETSLTVPGVRIVVDGGYRRTPRLDAGRGLARLVTERISRATATQRAGRAGREAPGTALRLWTRATDRALAPFDRPEILEAELSGFRLALALWRDHWGTEPAALAFADPPPRGAFEAAGALLEALGALDASGAITPLGARMARLGADPRLAAMILAAPDAPATALACRLAALLEERDPLDRNTAGAPHPASADLALRLELLEREAAAPRPSSALVARILEAERRLARRVGVPAGTRPAGDAAGLLASAFPDRIAQSRRDGAYRLSGGGSAALPPTDPLAREALLVAPGLHLGRSAAITLAAPLDAHDLPAALRARAHEQVERGLDAESGRVLARRRTRLGTLVLEDRTTPLDAEAAAPLLAEAAAPRLADLLDWTDPARDLQARAALAATHPGLAPPMADCTDAALAADAARFLAPTLAATNATRLADLARLDVTALLRARLGPAACAALDRLLPTTVALPNGHARIDYRQTPPVASARAQAFYGTDDTPRLAGGRVALTLALLSPAGRPAALTADLARFWRAGWTETRRDLRGRYPKHHWPERPWEPAPR